MFKKLELNDGEILRLKAVSGTRIRFGTAKQASSASLQSILGYYKWPRDEEDKKDVASSIGSGGEEDSSEGPKRRCDRKV